MSREHPLAPHRLALVGIILALAIVALLALRGPEWYQRLYHPLRYEQAIGTNAGATGLDPHLVAAVINVESGFNENDVSTAGAIGLMQLMPATAAEVARDSKLDVKSDPDTLMAPDVNIQLGTLHLAALTKQYSSLDEALAAYNAGSGNVDSWRRTAASTKRPFRDAIEFPATLRYVEDVLSERDIYTRLYPDAFPGAKK